MHGWMMILMIAWHSSYLHHVTFAKLKVLRRSSSSVLFHSFRRSIQQLYGHDETTRLHSNKPRNTLDNDVVSDMTLSSVKNPDEYCSLIEQYLYKHTTEHIVEPHHHRGVQAIHMLLCVSGGSDSMSMMHLLQRIKGLFQPAIQLMVVNFNHKMREESDEEVEFIREWALKYDMPFYARDLPVELRGTKSGFQEMARNWRRRECMAIVDELNAKLLLVGSTPPLPPPQQQHMIAGYNAIDSKLPTASSSSSATQSDHHHHQKRTPSTSFIVTAHTYDDQLETLLMKLVRGVHIANFQPMQTVDDSLIFFKPLLQLTKQQLIDYLMVRSLQWREDRSNQDSEQYKRNKVRLQLVPLMSELAGGKEALYKRMFTLSEHSGDVKDWINTEVSKYHQHHLIVYESSSCDESGYLVPYKMRFREGMSLEQVPKLVLMEIVNRWLLNSIGRQLSSDRLSSLYQLLHTPLPNGCFSKSITISQQHDITRVHNELRIYLRSSTSRSDDAVVGENTSDGDARNIIHQPTTNEASWSSLSNHTDNDSSDTMTMTIDEEEDDVEEDNNDDKNRLTSKIQFISRSNSSSNSIKYSIDVTVKHPYNTSIDVSIQANDGDDDDGCFYESRQESPTDRTASSSSSSSISQEDAVDPSTTILDTVDDRCDGCIDIELGVNLLVAKQPHHNIIHLELRSNRRGDHFWPVWKHHPIKLIDFIRGQKVASQHRYNVPVVSVAGVTDISPTIDGMLTQTADSSIIVACLIPTATTPAVASSSPPSSSLSSPAPRQSERLYKVFIAKPYTNQFCRAKPVDGPSLVSDDADTTATTASVIASSVDLPSVSRVEMVKMVLRIHMRTGE